MELLPLLFYLLFFGGLLLLIAVSFYAILARGKGGMTSRQAANYWREKFKDEMVLHMQQETLLRASDDTATLEVLLRAAEGQETPPEQLVRPAGAE